MPIAAAALSRMRSTIWVASGRPAPRYAPDRRGVGDDRLRDEVDDGNVVHGLAEHSCEHRQDCTDDRVSAGVRNHVRLQANDAAVVAYAHLHVHHHGAALHHRQHVFGAVLGPPGRAAQCLGCFADDDVLGVHRGLRAEAAADPRRGHPQLIRFEAERGCERLMLGVGVLHRQVQGHAAVATRHGHAPVGLHRSACQALGDDALRHDLISAGEGIHSRPLAGLLIRARDSEREAHVGCLPVPYDGRVGIGRPLEV